MNYRTMVKGALAFSLSLIVGAASAANVDVPKYGATFATSPAQYTNDQLGSAYAENQRIGQYNTGTGDNGFGWYAAADDESIITNLGNAVQGNVLQLNTDSYTLTNKFSSSVADDLNDAIDGTTANTEGAFFETEVKFVASDDLNAGIPGGTDATKFAIYAYCKDEGMPTNLVVYHAYEYIDENEDVQTGFTNDVFSSVLIDTTVYTKIRVEMKQITEAGTPINLFAVKVNDGEYLTSPTAYTEGGFWFKTTELSGSGTNRKVSSLNFKGTGEIDNISVGVIEKQADDATVIFVAEGDTVQSSAWPINANPSYTNAAPTKAADAAGVYTFAGWTNAATASVLYAPTDVLPAVVAGGATYTAVFTSVPAVASVNGDYYATLAEAIAEAGYGDTIVLNRDVTASWPTILENTSVVIDLAGHTLTANVDVYGELLVTNSVPATGALAGTVYVNGNDTDTADVVAHFTLAEDTVIEAEEYGIILWQADPNYGYDAQIDIYGTVKGCVWVMGNITEGDSVINVYGTVDATDKVDIGIALNGEATVNIFDGALVTSKDPTTESGTGIEVRAGELNVYGGTIVGTGDSYVFNPNGSGTTSYGVGIAVAQHTTAQDSNVNVEGGSITGVVAFATANPQQNADGSLVVDISGGEFIGTGANAIAVDSDDERINGFVSGGSFSSVLDADYCAEGYEPVTEPNADGLYTVQPIETYEITVSVTGGTISTGNVAVATGTTLVVPAGTEIAFAATDTYTLSSVTTNDIAVTGIDTTATSYTYTVGESDATVAVVFAGASAAEFKAGDTYGTVTLTAAQAEWLNGFDNYTAIDAALTTDSSNLVKRYLLNVDPLTGNGELTITAIVVGSDVKVTVELDRTEGETAVTGKAIKGTLKLFGTADLATGFGTEALGSVTFDDATFAESDTATATFTGSGAKFFKAVIE